MMRQAVLLVLFGFALGLSLLGVTLIPLLIEQGNELAQRLPDWIASGSQQLDAFQSRAVARCLPVDLSHWIIQLEN
jgi:predicted PurR-regulated permease PerM